MKAQVLAVVALVFALGACGSKMIKPEPTTAAGKDGLVKIWAAWVKDKGDKYDMNLNMTSEDEKKTILVYLSDISCSRGEMKGTVRHTFFNTGERNIQFAPKQSKAFNVMCILPSKTKGDYSVTVGKVFDNPSGDGKTAGKVIGENITWTHSDK